MFYSPIVSFSKLTNFYDYIQNYLTSYSGIKNSIPENIKILTLKQLSPGNVLLRLEHIFAKNEDADLSKPATIDLANLFTDFKVLTVKEMSLGANSFIENGSTSTVVTLNPQDIKTFLLTVQM
uniref:Glycosyl hydrolases family 38 C-terminal beta sandwich domain-containing protein n=1 Tax=Panagrolaimus sp. JU765 TaxID=591449 RepID=A0AC34RH78_9BILA